MSCEERVWTMEDVGSSYTPLYIWDSGNELWEMYANGELRHYRVISRTFLDDRRMKEVVERLDESAIPKEIYGKHLQKSLHWGIAKELEKETLNPEVWEMSPLSYWIPVNALHRDLSIG